MASPDLKVIVVTGDGDARPSAATTSSTPAGATSTSPSSSQQLDLRHDRRPGLADHPDGHVATTTPYGNVDPAFDIPELAKGAGATWVARGTAYHVPALDKLIIEAMQHKGLSVVEIINACPTTHGRRNKFKSPTDMLLWMKDTFLPAAAFGKLPPEKTAGKFPRAFSSRRRRRSTAIPTTAWRSA